MADFEVPISKTLSVRVKWHFLSVRGKEWQTLKCQ